MPHASTFVIERFRKQSVFPGRGEMTQVALGPQQITFTYNFSKRPIDFPVAIESVTLKTERHRMNAWQVTIILIIDVTHLWYEYAQHGAFAFIMKRKNRKKGTQQSPMTFKLAVGLIPMSDWCIHRRLRCRNRQKVKTAESNKERWSWIL